MNIHALFERQIQDIDELEVVVLRGVTSFPVIDKDFSTPNLVICLNMRGTATALYDLNHVHFTPNELAVVMPNHILHPIEVSENYLAILIVLSGGFVAELKRHTMTRNYIKYHISPSYQLTEEQVQQSLKLLDVIEMISSYPASALPNRHQMLLSQIDITFEMLNCFRHEQDKSHWEPRERIVFNDFCDLLAIHHRETHSVADYAAYLHISPKYFSSLIQKAIGVTAGEWIDQYLVTQIKKVLVCRADLSIQQVAFEFGFAESATFCRYFKHLTGLTPSEYRCSSNS